MTTSLINPLNGKRINGLKTGIDTGAFPNMIQVKHIIELEIDPTAEKVFNNPIRGDTRTFEFIAKISISNISIDNFKFNAFPSVGFPCDILLGMEFCKDFELFYSGRNKTFEIVLPEHF